MTKAFNVIYVTQGCGFSKMQGKLQHWGGHISIQSCFHMLFIHCHLPRFSCKHGMFPNLYVMPWKQDMKYRALHLQHADQVELYSGPREDTLFLEKSERHCHGEDRKKVMQKVPHEDIIVDIPIYSHLSRYHKSMVAYGFRVKL
ncbi:sperm-associated microtubule inner protein 10 [Pituophis catenifer annectens]|uniref:sperm-associated microtubule inner protein 10 n=1 Tax=Pituophis catenifer annectens TaxID=94852 RepID=UPI003994612F